jgi:hypothetical protein
MTVHDERAEARLTLKSVSPSAGRSGGIVQSSHETSRAVPVSGSEAIIASRCLSRISSTRPSLETSDSMIDAGAPASKRRRPPGDTPHVGLPSMP